MGRELSRGNHIALLIELNRAVEKAAEETARKVINGEILRDFPYGISYPPNGGLSEEEVEAIQKVRQIPGIESALRKILADAAADPISWFLSLIDGIGDPADERWTGASLLDKDETDEEGEFLNDVFPEAYWEWLKVRPEKGWRLDTWEGPEVITSFSDD